MGLILEQECYRVLGACFAVYRAMGCGLTEPIYQECLQLELAYLEIPTRAQPELPVIYRGQKLRHHLVPDFICFEALVLEIKAVSHLTDEHTAQVLNYLHASGHSLGLLVNFGHFPKAEFKRLAHSTDAANL